MKSFFVVQSSQAFRVCGCVLSGGSAWHRQYSARARVRSRALLELCSRGAAHVNRGRDVEGRSPKGGLCAAQSRRSSRPRCAQPRDTTATCAFSPLRRLVPHTLIHTHSVPSSMCPSGHPSPPIVLCGCLHRRVSGEIQVVVIVCCSCAEECFWQLHCVLSTGARVRIPLSGRRVSFARPRFHAFLLLVRQ